MPHRATIPVGALSALPGIMRQLGADPWELLAPYGIAPDSFAQPLNPLPMSVHGKVLDAAAQATGCDHLGLLLGQRADLGNTGPLRFLMLNAPTVGAAIDELLHFSPIWYPGIIASLDIDGEYGTLSVAVHNSFVGSDQVLTGYLTANVKILELVLGHTWRPLSVRVAHREPASATPYRLFFGCPVLFDQPRHEVWFPRQILEHERDGEGTDRQLQSFLHERLGELRGEGPVDFVAQVRRVIQGLLPSERCNAGYVASFFHVHRQTMHRHLARHGTSFEELRDDARRDLATQLLGSTNLSLTEISATLGYTTQSSFTRAFKRWLGETPVRWRGRHSVGAVAGSHTFRAPRHGGGS